MPASPPSLTGHDFTSAARAATAHARQLAAASNHAAVRTDHLLLALAEKPDHSVAAVLAALSLDPSRVRSAIRDADNTPGSDEKAADRGSHGTGPALTHDAKRVLTHAMDEARALGDPYVGTEHLLLALCAADGSCAARALRSLRVSHAQLQELTRGLHGARGDADTARGAAGFRVAIDDTSNRSIYEQIIAQIQEGIATAALRPGDRLPTVRQLADDLDVAPGTVARAYAELERAGAVITEGTRGTRVAKREDASATSPNRHGMLVALLRPVAVAAFHLGAAADDLRAALAEAMRGIFPPGA